MGLIANGVRLSSSNPMIQRGAPSAGSQERACWDNQGSNRNIWAGEAGVSNRAGFSDGARHPVAWIMAPKGGALSARDTARVEFAAGPLALAEGRNIGGATSVTWTVADAQLQLVVSASGSASVTFSVANAALAGALSASGTTSFAFTVSNATLGAIVDALASVGVTFSGSATARATGHLTGSITPFTELSPQNLAQSVLDAVVEGDVKLGEVLRILLAYSSGDATGLDSAPTFKSRDGSKTRLSGTVAGGARTITTFDPT